MLMYTYVYIYMSILQYTYISYVQTLKRGDNKCICRYTYVYINIHVERHGPRVATSLFVFPSKRDDVVLVLASTKKKAIGLRMEIVKHMQTHFFPFSTSCVTSFSSRMRFISSSIVLRVLMIHWAHFTCPLVTFVSCQQM